MDLTPTAVPKNSNEAKNYSEETLVLLHSIAQVRLYMLLVIICDCMSVYVCTVCAPVITEVSFNLVHISKHISKDQRSRTVSPDDCR